jgi:hypothetical protein|tara:strand:+ start:7711 stop:8151 length:441 start_codon:yes stop_codon:yes gene_type:complete
MPEARWFLAHQRHDDDADINDWTSRLTFCLADNSGWSVTVVSGRDDYHSRAPALGGWKPWSKDVARGADWRGKVHFHGVVVPVDSTEEVPTVAGITATIVRGFISSGKHAFVWCPRTEAFRAVTTVVDIGDDDWKARARLELMVES